MRRAAATGISPGKILFLLLWYYGCFALEKVHPLQGGYLAVFIDELFATAIASVLEEGEWAMTAEFKINFLRALTPAPLEGRGRVMRRSRTLAFLEAQVESEGGQIAVTASSTWAVMKR